MEEREIWAMEAPSCAEKAFVPNYNSVIGNNATMTLTFVILYCVISGTALSEPIRDELIVTTPDGKIRGSTYETNDGKIYYGFRGIPYAASPVGELRFEPPQPPQPWSGILNATKDGNACISSSYLQDPENESEDCLFVNVYTPDIQPKEKLTVMVWIHGGTFVSGSGNKQNFGPDFLVEQDVILVTMNYRLGPFGWISTLDENLPGNYGLKDQNLALSWTRRNIKYFGGDPEKITLFGQSAGATSVGLQLISKKSAGLFRAAIVQSGSALVDWSNSWDVLRYTYLVANSIPGGNYGNDTKALKEFLKNSSVEDIMAGFALISGIDHMVAVIEPEHEGAFITESHYELFDRGDFTQVPIIIGICALESLAQFESVEHATEIGEAYDKDPTTIIPVDLRQNSSDTNIVVQKIKDIYYKGNETFPSNLVALINLYSDYHYTRGIIKHGQMASKYVPVYLYEFAYYGRSENTFFLDGAERAVHGSENVFIFNSTLSPGNDTASDILTQNRMVKLWTNFAKYLNPTPESSELFNNVTWERASPDNLQYLNINNTLELRHGIKKEVFAAWNDIYYTYGKRPFITF